MQALPQRRGARARTTAADVSGQRSKRLTVCVTAAQSSTATARSGHRRAAKRRQDAGWAQGIVQRQIRQLERLDRITDRLQDRLLDLDLDKLDVYLGKDARARSNETASSSSSSESIIMDRSGKRGRMKAGRAAGRVPPSPEVLVALLRRADAKRALLQELDVRSPKAVARRLLLLSSLLDLPPDRLVAMSRQCGRLLLTRPDQLRSALTALTHCVETLTRQQQQPQQAPSAVALAGEARGNGRSASRGGAGVGSSGSGGGGGDGGSSGNGVAGVGKGQACAAAALAREMLGAVPELLLVAPERLRRSGLELGAVCKARGVKVLPLLSSRPDLLLQSAASLAAKMDVLPGLLGLPPRRLREVLAARPDLLRRSPRQLSRRYKLLGELCELPLDYLAELITQEPGVLSFGADTLRAKFEALVGQYGRFQDDVADMILVDPTVLLNAPPAAGKVSSSSGGGSGSGPNVLPVLNQVLQLSEASGIPMAAVLQLVVQDERVCSYSREDVAAQLAAAAAALELDEQQVRSRVRDHPGLLLLPREELAGRVEALTRLLQPPTDGTADAASGSAGRAAEGVAAPAAVALLRSQPELLLQDPVDLYSRLTQLSTMLLGTAPAPDTGLAAAATAPASPGEEPAAAAAAAAAAAPPPLTLPPSLLALVAAHPSLLTAPLSDTEDKLLVMQSLFEIPRALVLELVLREPALLSVSGDALERKFRSLAASFGAFSSDAIDVVLADPALILRADDDPDNFLDALSPLPPPPQQQLHVPYTKQQKQKQPASPADVGAGSGTSISDLGGGGTGSRRGGAAADTATRSGRSRQQRERGRDRDGGSGGGRNSSSAGSGSNAAGEAAADAAAETGGRRQQQPQSRGESLRSSVGDDNEAVVAEWLAQRAAEESSSGVRSGLIGRSGSDAGGGGGGGRGTDMGLLGAMSAADFDKLGSEDLPPPPPPSSRRRRRQ